MSKFAIMIETNKDGAMGKTLSEMTLEELWQLFPVFLTEHNPDWAAWYAEEAARIEGLLPPDTELFHIGSTAVNGIKAKPIVDIPITVSEPSRLTQAAQILQSNGCIIMSRGAERISLNRGYTENGFAERVFHYHIRLRGDTDEILFRDYLNSRPDVAKEYEALKLKLCKKFEHDRDAYTDAKTEFVKKYTLLAKAQCKNA